MGECCIILGSFFKIAKYHRVSTAFEEICEMLLRIEKNTPNFSFSFRKNHLLE